MQVPPEQAEPDMPSTPTTHPGTKVDHERSEPIEPSAAAETSSAAANADLWAPLLDAGLQWLSALAAPPAPGGVAADSMRITIDPRTGQRSLTLPLPDPATVQRVAEKLTELLARLQR